MSNHPESPHQPRKRQFPQRVLIADVAHPDREEAELELLPDDRGWGDLPTASYVLEGGSEE